MWFTKYKNLYRDGYQIILFFTLLACETWEDIVPHVVLNYHNYKKKHKTKVKVYGEISFKKIQFFLMTT